MGDTAAVAGQPGTTNRRLLLATVFSAGFVSLGIEMAASRLLGSVFGTANLVWANIIGLILLYLTAGYFIGGRWADRSPNYSTFYRILAWAGFSAGLVPLVARPVLRFAASAVERLDAAIMAGSFVSVLVLFIVPVTLLGCVSPFAIRLSLGSADQAGTISGRIYAISTLGSILGTFSTVLWLIPQLGTARTFLALSLGLLLFALIGIGAEGRRSLVRYAWMPVVLLLAAWLALSSPMKSTEGQIYEGESGYNYIEVIERGGYWFLLLNEGQAVHSVYSPESLVTFGTWDYFVAAPFFNPAPHSLDAVKRVGIVGLAAGTIAKQYTASFGAIPIDGWEIDPEIIEVGRKYFDMTEPNLNAIAVDGRLGLQQSRERYSVIAIDAYRPPYIPWHLTTVEFFSLVHDRLTADGVLVINVGRTPEDRRLIEALVGTLDQVFETIHVADVPATFNSIVYATVRPTSADDLRANLDQLRQSDPGSFLTQSVGQVASNLKPTPDTEIVFTDDHAPVERLVNSIVINYLLGNAETVLSQGLQP